MSEHCAVGPGVIGHRIRLLRSVPSLRFRIDAARRRRVVDSSCPMSGRVRRDSRCQETRVVEASSRAVQISAPATFFGGPKARSKLERTSVASRPTGSKTTSVTPLRRT